MAGGPVTSHTSAMLRRSSPFVSWSLLVFALVAGSAAAVTAQRAPRAPEAPPDVLLIGSSSVNGALGRLIEAEIERAGLRVTRDGHPSTGFSRPDFYDWEAQIPRLGDLTRLRGLVVYLGGNDAQAFRFRSNEVPAGTPESRQWIQFRDEARWSEAYRRRTRQFVEALCNAHARKVVIVPPIDGDTSSHSERIRRVQRLQIEGTNGTRCGVVADPSEVRLGPAQAGDGVHLNREGARAVWNSIGPTILGALR